MKQFVGLICAPDAQADLIHKLDAMDFGKLEPWHAYILTLMSNARLWHDYSGDGREFDTD